MANAQNNAIMGDWLENKTVVSLAALVHSESYVCLNCEKQVVLVALAKTKKQTNKLNIYTYLILIYHLAKYVIL